MSGSLNKRKSRNVIEVTQKIIDKVPMKYEERLKQLKDTFFYKAPELWPGCFGRLSSEVVRIISEEEKNDGTPVRAWEWGIASILADKTVRTLKEL